MAIYCDMSYEDYVDLDGMRPSTLKNHKSMKHLKRKVDGEITVEPTHAIKVGLAVHSLIESEDSYASKYAVMPAYELSPDNLTVKGEKPQSPRSTTYYKEMVEIWRLDNASKEELTEVQANTARKVAQNLRTRCHELLDASAKEVVVTGTIEGVEFKTRLDGLCVDLGLVYDIKTTSSVDNQSFWRVFNNLGYGFSAAVHRELLAQNSIHIRADGYLFLACEVEGDYDVRALTVPAALLDNELSKVKSVARKWKIATELNHYPGLPDDDLWVPNWAMTNWEEEEELSWA